MTTQDILLLSFVISKEAAFCRGESDWWPPRADEIKLVKTLYDEGSCIDYLSQGEKVRPVVMKLRKSLQEFLDCASDELIDGNPKAITVKMTVPFCKAWLNWIDAYFPIDPNGQEQPHQEQGNEEPVKQDDGFRSCLLIQDDKKDELLKKLHLLIDGKKGKPVALVIRLCVELGLMSKPTFGVLEAEFGDIGNPSGYNAFYRNYSNKYTKVEINGIKVHLEPFLNLG